MIDSKITDLEAQQEVSKVTNVTSNGRMYIEQKDFFQLTRIKETLTYLRDSNFFETVTKGNLGRKRA